ncbi:MAG: sigma-54-dependent Fis family transcriptional regulator [Candidatus Omnitrophota bacterium]|jgi:DNA-binding NtrC family response regulator|nr:MAG: sigma-54-dependent Fis family transcriptional regulator [Candidatus Omnitrophota bacterium]
MHNNHGHILIIDDEPLVRRSLSEMLTVSGYAVSTACNGSEALNLLKDYTVDIIISDMKMPEMDGMQLLKSLKSLRYDAAVILMTGYGTIDGAVEAMRHGAYDYVTKPIVDSEIKIIIKRYLDQCRIKEENLRLKEQLSVKEREVFLDIVGKDEKMQKIYNLIEAVSNTRATVLIHGESGTGKRLIAHAIHNCTTQEKKKPFVEVSCGALTDTLLESELFGHVKGAFTGAIKDKMGRFELADGGTIFLDEIDAFSPVLQVKLLRVLQEGDLERVGDNKTIKVDVRIIAATNQSLEQLIEQGKFRKDLYYRLNIISIEVPPLRLRKLDIPLLVKTFISKHSKSINKKIDDISDKALSLLIEYSWPGNIRELENVIERTIILCKGPVISHHDLPDFLQKQKFSSESAAVDKSGCLKLKDALIAPEKELIINTLNTVNWNRTEAAKALGINRTTLYKKMGKLGLLKNNGREQ